MQTLVFVHSCWEGPGLGMAIWTKQKRNAVYQVSFHFMLSAKCISKRVDWEPKITFCAVQHSVTAEKSGGFFFNLIHFG